MKNQTVPYTILMIKNQNILATLKIFLSQLKAFMKNLIQKRQRPKLPLLNFLVQFLSERKSQINNFTIARQTIF